MGYIQKSSLTIRRGNSPAYKRIADRFRQETFIGRYLPATLLPFTEAIAR